MGLRRESQQQQIYDDVEKMGRNNDDSQSHVPKKMGSVRLILYIPNEQSKI
jgi:hypothetical protein